jgi:hypothetical protein
MARIGLTVLFLIGSIGFIAIAIDFCKHINPLYKSIEHSVLIAPKIIQLHAQFPNNQLRQDYEEALVYADTYYIWPSALSAYLTHLLKHLSFHDGTNIFWYLLSNIWVCSLVLLAIAALWLVTEFIGFSRTLLAKYKTTTTDPTPVVARQLESADIIVPRKPKTV